MSAPVRMTLGEAEVLATRALAAAGAAEPAARATARALVAAEADGQAGHGLSRVPPYALHLGCGKVKGDAVPTLEQAGAAVLRVDAGLGFAYPAIELALERLAPLARETGIAAAAVHRSHHFGQAGAHAEKLAAAGLVALVFGNTPKAMAFHGGRRPMIGTNPLAFAAPSGDAQAPFVVDLALSVAARGRIVAAKAAGREIPPDWAVDAQGRPTTDPAAALDGALVPIGGAKGAALALFVEVLAAALTGGRFGWEASSYFDDRGGPPDMGHLFVALDPRRLSGGSYDFRIATLLGAVAAEDGVRLPGSRRLDARARAAREGVVVPAALHAELAALAARS